MAGATAGAIEEILAGEKWLEPVSKECQQEECLCEETARVVEEGLCCLRASGGSSNNKELGGWRSCRCYREALGECKSVWSGCQLGVSKIAPSDGESTGGCGGPLLPPSEWRGNNKEVGGWSSRGCTSKFVGSG